MPIRVFFGAGLLAKETRPRARRVCNPTHVMITTWKQWLAVAACFDRAPDVSANPCYQMFCQSKLIAAVAACSWLQSRHAVASCEARGMSWRAVAACSCVLRRDRCDFALAS